MGRPLASTPWPAIVFTSPDPQERKRLERAAKRGALSRLGHGIYLRTAEDAGTALASHWPEVIDHLAGTAAHVSHRTALNFNPFATDWFVAWPQKRYRQVNLGAKRVLIVPGMPRPETHEVGFLGKTGRVSTRETALLEVTEKRRGAFGPSTLGDEELEEFLLAHAARVDLPILRELARRNGRDPSALIEKIEAILSRDASKLRSPRVRSILDASGADPARVRTFADLASFMGGLSSTAIEGRAWSSNDSAQLDRFCFIAAYFSNYIEGTEFAPEDAAAIVYQNADRGPAPDQRTLAATYRTYLQLLTTLAPIPSKAPYSDFEAYLKRLHRSLAGGNEALRPGEFKTRPNQVGGRLFVEPGRVEPTLRAGWELASAIGSPFHRAVFLGFVVSEVHPFTDGNGRAARMMTDAHLLSAGFSGLVVTTRSRDLYIRALGRAYSQDPSEGDWKEILVSTFERLYRHYRDPPVRSLEAALDFCARENLEATRDD